MHSEMARSLYESTGYRRAVTFSLVSNGRSLARLGQLEESGHVLEQALELQQQLRNELEAGWDATLIAVEGETRMAIAANLASTGRFREATEELERSAEASRRVSHRPNQFEALRRLAELLISTGDRAGANDAFERARAVLASFPDGGPEKLRRRFTLLAEKLTRNGAG